MLLVDSLTDGKLNAHTIDWALYMPEQQQELDKKKFPEEENIKQVLKGSFQSSLFCHFGIAQDLANYRH